MLHNFVTKAGQRKMKPVKPVLKVPGLNSPNLKTRRLLSSSAFNLKLRRYTKATAGYVGATRLVGRCRLTVSKSMLNASMVSALETGIS